MLLLVFLIASMQAKGQDKIAFHQEENVLKKLNNQLAELHSINQTFLYEIEKLKDSILNTNAKKHSFSALGGYTENGFAFLGSYNFYNRSKNERLDDFIELSFLASFAKEDITDYKIPIHNYTLNTGYFKFIPFLSGNRLELTTSIGIGGSLGYESINSNASELPNGAIILDKSKFIYGGFVGINFDIYLSKNLDITAKSNLYYHTNSDTGKTKIFAGVGIKYSILKNNKQ